MVDYTLTDDMEANAATFNILFGDVNLRLKELEKAGSALKKARDEIVDLGLARINEVVGPALQAVEDISDLSDLFRAATLSSVEIGTGVREFNIEPGDRLKFAAPLYVAIAVNGQLDKWMAGQVQSWNNETGQLMVDVTNIRGEGIFADWVVTPTHIPETGPTINAYTKAEVDAIVAQAKADLLGGSPAAALDTLAELAAALADDASFAATITAQLAGKADANDLGALAALDKVDTAQIVDGAITAAKLDANAIPPAPAGTPTGSVLPFAGSTAPEGWLLCGPTAYSRTTYADLFAVCGETFGVGDGSTTFNIPNPAGRAVIGAGTGSGLTPRTAGATGGEEDHVLSTAEMPAHSHTHTRYSSTVNSGTNNKGYSMCHGSTTGTTSTTGSSAAHNNMQPWLALNYIIKT